MMTNVKNSSLLDRADIVWDEKNLSFANKIEDMSLFTILGDFENSNKRKNEVFDMFMQMKKCDDVILETIIDLHKRALAIGEVTPRISAQIEILRFARNTALGQTQKEGDVDEKLYLISMEMTKKRRN